MKQCSRRGYLVALALVLALVAYASPVQTDAASQRPSLVVQTLSGQTFDLAHERGRWVIVNFWATWCSPCIAEIPAISRFVARHRDVTAIGLAWDRSPRKAILAFVRKHPVAYPLAQVDPEHPPAGIEAPQALPTTLLIAPDGRVAKRFLGPVNARLLSQAIAGTRAKPATSER